MPTTALYQWSVAGSPIYILVELPLVDRFHALAVAGDVETGGLLVGHFEGNYTIITDFEAIESEHRRGSAYNLSTRDESRLRARLAVRRPRESVVVGYFRTHLRPGMFLDEGDHQVISSYFHSPNQVVLLIRPSGDGAAAGGFFFWEEGEINRKQTYLTFPMSSQELEAGDFPLVEPVGGENGEFAGDATQTIADHPSPLNNATVERAAAPKEVGAPVSKKLNWPVIAAIAAAAAFGGYLIGTSGSRSDRFGARPGDISLTSPDASVPAEKKPQHPEAKSSTPVPLPADANAQPAGPAGVSSGDNPAVDSTIASAVPPAADSKARTPTARVSPVTPRPASGASAVPAGDLTADGTPASPGWQRFKPQPATIPPGDVPPQIATNTPAPVPEPVVTRPEPAAESSVYLESVEDSGVRRVVSKIPLFGRIGGRYKGGGDFTPPLATHSFAPKVPHDIARQITATLPVDLKLNVDKNGRVTSVELLSKQTSPELVRLAGDAAYDWKFEPARMKDRPVASDIIAHFRFRPAL